MFQPFAHIWSGQKNHAGDITVICLHCHQTFVNTVPAEIVVSPCEARESQYLSNKQELDLLQEEYWDNWRQTHAPWRY